jgi:hypothetical protein
VAEKKEMEGRHQLVQGRVSQLTKFISISKLVHLLVCGISQYSTISSSQEDSLFATVGPVPSSK